MDSVESKGSRAIAERMIAIEPGTPRYQVLEVARTFKTSWVALGNKLWEVRRKKLHAEWGYASFDEYCREEIRIKPRTAAKLTASYAFLRSEEPSVLKRDGIEKSIPDLEVVEMLRRAREVQVPEKGYGRIRELALGDAPVAVLRRELREVLPPPEPPPPEKIVRQLVAQANRLADSLASARGIPRVILERALALVDDLRALMT